MKAKGLCWHEAHKVRQVDGGIGFAEVKGERAKEGSTGVLAAEKV